MASQILRGLAASVVLGVATAAPGALWRGVDFEITADCPAWGWELSDPAPPGTSYLLCYGDTNCFPALPGDPVCLVDPYHDPDQTDSWHPSPVVGGTPGAENGFGPGPGRMRPPRISPICINEARAGAETFIELFNRSHQKVEITGWFLSDSPHDPGRFVFPADSHIPAGGFLLLEPEPVHR